MLLDFSEIIINSEGTIAASVAKRRFDKYYSEFIQHYESLMALESELSEEDLTSYQSQFSEVNKLMVTMDQRVAASGACGTSDTGHTKDQLRTSQVKARLPLIELPKFSGKLIDWVPFYDLFQSLVHERDNMSDAEKHYYLRASLESEALSIIRQLPMDEANYEVALNLLKGRYQNQRLLIDTYLDRITNLPVLQGHHSLRSDLFDPLRESVQALEALKVPVKEWSYLIVFITLQKLPMRIRALYEERYGKSREDLPTLTQLMELLDEQCRLYQSVSEPSWSRPSRQSPPLRGKKALTSGRSSAPRASESASAARGRLHSSEHTYQVTSSSCSFCQSSDHTLYRCSSFKAMSPRERKTWARNGGQCFKCLRKHYATECQQKNWCYYCKSPDHNSLLCLVKDSKGQGSSSRVNTSETIATSVEGRPRNSPVRSPTPRQVQSTFVVQEPFIPTPHYQRSRPNVGEKALRAQNQFHNLRYGLSFNDSQE